MATAGDIITSALTECGLIRPGSTANSDQVAYALSKLNRLKALHSMNGVMCFNNRTDVFLVTSAQQSYTVGPTGQFVITPRPSEITNVNWLLPSSQQVRVPLRVLNTEEWANTSPKYLSGSIPTAVYVDYGAPNLTLYFVPYPSTTGASIEIFSPQAIQTFGSTADTLVAPEGYEEWLTAILTEGICLGLHRPVTQDIAEAARKARVALTAVNSGSTSVDNDMPAGGKVRGAMSQARFESGSYLYGR